MQTRHHAITARSLLRNNATRRAQRANGQETAPAQPLICAWQLLLRRSTPDRLPEIFGICLSAAAIPVRTDLTCTRTVPENRLRTPRRVHFCRRLVSPTRPQAVP